MCGKGYLSSSVQSFKRRKSPHGLHDPSGLGTMWRGDDHGLSDLRMIPSSKSLSKAWRAQLGESLRTEATSFGKDGGSAGGYRMHNAVCITMSAKSWLLYFREFQKEVLIHSRCLDLERGRRIRCGESGWNGVNHSVIHKTKDPLALEVDTQAVGVEKVGAEKWSSHIGQDELVFEVDAGKV